MIKPPNSSIDQDRAHANGRRLRALAGPVALLLLPLFAESATGAMPALPELSFTAGSVEYENARLEGVYARLTESGEFVLSFDRLQGTGEPWLGSGLALSGRLQDFSRDGQAMALAGVLQALGLQARLSLQTRPDEWRLNLDLAGQPAAALAELPGLPAATGWIRAGRFDAALEWWQAGDGAPALNFRTGVAALSFDSPEGRYAAEGLAASVEGRLVPGAAVGFEIEGALQTGELLVGDFYRDFTGAVLQYSLAGTFADRVVSLDRIGLADDGALTADAAARVSLGEADSEAKGEWSLEVNRLELAFPGAYRRYLEPMAGVWTLDGLEMTGHLSWSGEFRSGALVSGDLEISDFSVVDIDRERFAVTGLEARLRPGDHDFDSRIRWQGLLFGSINLGEGSALLDSEPGTIALLEPLRLDTLGGRVELSTLRVVLPGSRAEGRGEPDIRLQAGIENLRMRALTQAVDWPEFGGTISGEIPGVSLNEGVLSVDGEIRFEVFDGLVSLQNLRVERPFGVLPSLAADIDISNLDLEQLTSAFSFGQIAGRLDGQVSDLRMLDWKPVAFDAWLGTPERQTGSNDISRQAVNRLTTIGGGSPTTALTSPLMRMFSNFSYRRLGLGCTLANNVCHLRGLSDDGSSVLILEGAGVPKITIRAFNRNIDWPQMVSNLVAISEGDSIQIGEPPEP